MSEKERYKLPDSGQQELEEAANMASLFMTPQELGLLAEGNQQFKAIYNGLLQQEAQKGKNPGNLGLKLRLEEQALDLLFKRLPGYEETATKYQSLVMSCLEISE